MHLEAVGLYNDLSNETRKELEERVVSFGDTVEYQFNISKENPDPDKYNGPLVWPSRYSLDPTIISYRDKKEDRKDKSTLKQVALISQLNGEGKPVFGKVRVLGQSRGRIRLDLKNKPADFAYAMYMELHPKLKGGINQDKTVNPIFERVDTKFEAAELREKRNMRAKALGVASAMLDDDIRQFAAAMQWEYTGEVEVLRNQVEDLAENEPKLFNDLVDGKELEIRALVQKAIDQGIVLFEPAEYKFSWASNGHIIITLSEVSGKSHVERFAGWLLTSHKQGEDVVKRLKGLVK